MIGGLYSQDFNHAWVQIYKGSRVRVLECTPAGYNIPIAAASANEYKPMMSLSSNLCWHDHLCTTLSRVPHS